MRIRGISRLRCWARSVRNLVNAPAVILLYHRVADLSLDPQLLCVHPQRFAEHLEHLRRHYHPVSLHELKQALDNGHIRRQTVVVTFDDGYADNLWNAKPLLERFDVPATVFIVSGQVDAQHEFWWDELERALLLPPTLPALLQLVIAGQHHTWTLEGSRGRQNVYGDIHRLLRPMDGASRRDLLVQLAQWAGVPLTMRSTHRPLTSAEVQQLSDGGLIEVGSHSASHPVFSAQPPEVQACEIIESKQQVEKILGKLVTSFSYPYGGCADVPSDVIAMVRQSGFKLACGNVPRTVHRWTEPFWLPRCLVRDGDGDRFAAELRRFFRL